MRSNGQIGPIPRDLAPREKMKSYRKLNCSASDLFLGVMIFRTFLIVLIKMQDEVLLKLERTEPALKKKPKGHARLWELHFQAAKESAASTASLKGFGRGEDGS